MKLRRSILALTLAAAFAGGAAAAPEFDVAKEDERVRLATIERDAKNGDESVVYAVDEVFAKLARTAPVRDGRNAPADMVLDEPPAPGTTGVTMRSYRTLAFETAKRLPPAIRKKVIDAQKDAEATERKRGTDDETYLIRRFPFAPGAAANAWRFAQRAFDEGDDTAALSWDRLAVKLAALQLQTESPPPTARVRRCAALIRSGDLESARSVLRRLEGELDPKAQVMAFLRERLARAQAERDALASRKPPEGLLPDLFASYQLNKADPPSSTPQVLSPPVSAHVGDLVLASDGSRLIAVDARTGELQGRLPLEDPKGTPPATGVPGLVTALGDLVASPIFCEKFMTPARTGDTGGERTDADDTEPSVRGGFFSLFTYDARSLRILWSDGEGASQGSFDEGTRARPAGMESLDERGWGFYAKKHVIGRPLMDGKRIYFPLVSTLSESQLWIVALERRAGENGALVLAPAWRTFLSVASQAAANQPQNLTIPSVNARLSLDIEGRLYVQTDQGFLAALDVRTGGIDWIHRVSDDDALRAARARTNGGGYHATSDPPVAFSGDGTRPSVVVMASPDDERWLGLDAEDGSVVWRSDVWTAARSGGFTPGRGEGPRVLALSPSVALGYGGQSFVAFDAFTGSILVEPNKVRAVRLEDGERLAGAAVHAGPGLLLVPTDQGRVRKLTFREESKNGRRIELALGEDVLLQGVPQRAPVHLIALEGRLVATTPARLLVYTWVARGE